MPEEIFRSVVNNASSTGLLNHVTIVGGEPFIDTEKLIGAIQYLLDGNGILDIFIPTNGRWVLHDNNYIEVAEILNHFSIFVPHGITVAFSKNRWNLEQLGDKAELVCKRWIQLELRFPNLFTTRILTETDMKSAGRAKNNELARTGVHVGAHCDFDDWVDPIQKIGFYSDYLCFWPDGLVRTCYSGGPIVGNYKDDLNQLLEYRAQYLFWLRRDKFNRDLTGALSFRTCEDCDKLFTIFQKTIIA